MNLVWYTVKPYVGMAMSFLLLVGTVTGLVVSTVVPILFYSGGLVAFQGETLRTIKVSVSSIPIRRARDGDV